MSKNEYAPFRVLSHGENTASLILTNLGEKAHVFQQWGGVGWCGSGFDWALLARVLLRERLPQLADLVDLEPDADMFAATGPDWAMRELGASLRGVFRDDAQLRDLLDRADPS